VVLAARTQDRLRVIYPFIHEVDRQRSLVRTTRH
jgi:hypothetical protein